MSAIKQQMPAWLQRRLTKKSIIAWLLLWGWPVAKGLWWLVEKAGDIDFLVSVWPKIQPSLPMILNWVWSYGWILLMPVGLLWLWWVGHKEDAAAQEDEGDGERQRINFDGFTGTVQELYDAYKLERGYHHRWKSEAGRRGATIEEPHQLTDYERDTVDALRNVYTRGAKWAAEAIWTVLGETLVTVAPANPLAPLMSNYRNALRDAERILTAALEPDATDSLREVSRRFGDFFRIYMLTVRVCHLGFRDLAYRKAPQERIHNEWRPAHSRFKELLDKTLYRSVLADLQGTVESIGWDVEYRDPTPSEPHK